MRKFITTYATLSVLVLANAGGIAHASPHAQAKAPDIRVFEAKESTVREYSVEAEAVHYQDVLVKVDLNTIAGKPASSSESETHGNQTSGGSVTDGYSLVLIPDDADAVTVHLTIDRLWHATWESTYIIKRGADVSFTVEGYMVHIKRIK